MNNQSFRLAEIKDSPMLLDWRNDPATRYFRNDKRIIKMEEHLEWIEKRQKSVNKIYIYEESSIPVSHICLDISEIGTELGWVVGPKYRNKGVAKRMIAFSKKTVIQTNKIWAKARKDNIPSINVALHSGFYLFKIEGDMFYFRDNLFYR